MKKGIRVIMSFDFGTKNIGIAIGQGITCTSETLFSLKANDGNPNWKELDDLVLEWKPDLFVVGDPLNMDGSNSEIKILSDKFAKKIINRYKIPLEFVDERLTSKEAANIIDEKKKKDLAIKDIHQLSAKIILDDWFRRI